jgi:carotenoid 1,2-hydratase
LRFDEPVANGGYAWWYIDALSADGQHGLTLIAFIGSVFSPYYAWARRRAAGSGPAASGADPLNHCALNVALYGRRTARWSMTERRKAEVHCEASNLTLGPSTLEWSADGMSICVDEVCAPLPRRIRGTIHVKPTALGTRSFRLDAAGRHHWTPFAPRAHIEVTLKEPALSWTGIAYLDSNTGCEPLEDAFRYWTWSRAALLDETVVLYDVEERKAPARAMALRFDAHAQVTALPPPPLVRLPVTRWRVHRETRADTGHGVRLVETLEDAPFYSRSLLATHLAGSPGPAVHESLDLDRFSSRWVQCLLPFRMPRRIV